MKLYILVPNASPPCRAVLLTIKAAKIEEPIEIVPVAVMNGEHLTPDYLKINPFHSLPSFDENGFILRDSHSIMTYLCDKYGKTESLYPKDLKKRARVNELLFIDTERINGSIIRFTAPQVFDGVPTSKLSDLQKKMEHYLATVNDILLKDTQYLTGSEISIADFSFATTITYLEQFGYDIEKWSNICRFVKRIKKLPYWEECNDGLIDLGEYVKTLENIKM